MSKTLAIYQFGPFRLDPSRRQLTRDGVPVTLSSRAFEVLHLLARQEGGLVTRNEILAHVWRGVTVEENNLTVQISALRRALGDLPDGAQPIMTVPNQGYRLAGQVRRVALGENALESLPGEPAAPPPGAAASVGRKPRYWWAGLAAAAALLAAIALPRLLHTPPNSTPSPAATPPPLSIVVLPFRNLSSDHGDDALADAISDDLTTDLAHIPASVVIARESADTYKGRAVPTDQIGRALNVHYILEGSLRAVGDRLFINAQLIEAPTGQHLWADRFDVRRVPVGAAQITIVRRLSSALGATLPQIEAARSLRERPENPDALDLFLRSRAQFSREESLQSMKAARVPLEQAIAKQPDYVDALAELGWQLASMNLEFNRFATEDDLAMAQKVTAHALDLDRNNPWALGAIGTIQLVGGNSSAAESSFQAAVAIDPNNSRAWFGLYLTAFETARWQDAYDRMLHLREIDPASPNARYHEVYQGYTTLLLGRPWDAVTLMQQGEAGFQYPVPGMATWDDIGSDWLFLTAAYVMSGDLARGRDEYAAISIVWPHRSLFRVGEYASRADAHDPAFMRVMDALRQAGLPDYADEHENNGVAATSTPTRHGDFDASPVSVPGVPTIDTPALAKLVRAAPPPLLIDMGVGVARPLGAIAGKFDPLSAESAQHFARELTARLGNSADRKMVVFSDGTYGWRSYNAVLQLKAAGMTNLVWYRGGEEAWARAGLPSDDVRNP